MPYRVFEDQRSGETLGGLQRVRTDVERFIAKFVSVLAPALVGVGFIIVYSAMVHWAIAPAFLVTMVLLAGLGLAFSRGFKTMQRIIVAETTALVRATIESLRNSTLVRRLGLTDEEVGRLNATTGRILELELMKACYLRLLSFVQGTAMNSMRSVILFLMLFLIVRQQISTEFFAITFDLLYVFGPLRRWGSSSTRIA
jgi:ATP-binding cassette subfamily B protein